MWGGCEKRDLRPINEDPGSLFRLLEGSLGSSCDGGTKC